MKILKKYIFYICCFLLTILLLRWILILTQCNLPLFRQKSFADNSASFEVKSLNKRNIYFLSDFLCLNPYGNYKQDFANILGEEIQKSSLNYQYKYWCLRDISYANLGKFIPIIFPNISPNDIVIIHLGATDFSGLINPRTPQIGNNLLPYKKISFKETWATPYCYDFFNQNSKKEKYDRYKEALLNLWHERIASIKNLSLTKNPLFLEETYKHLSPPYDVRCKWEINIEKTKTNPIGQIRFIVEELMQLTLRLEDKEIFEKILLDVAFLNIPELIYQFKGIYYSYVFSFPMQGPKFFLKKIERIPNPNIELEKMLNQIRDYIYNPKDSEQKITEGFNQTIDAIQSLTSNIIIMGYPQKLFNVTNNRLARLAQEKNILFFKTKQRFLTNDFLFGIFLNEDSNHKLSQELIGHIRDTIQ